MTAIYRCVALASATVHHRHVFLFVMSVGLKQVLAKCPITTPLVLERTQHIQPKTPHFFFMLGKIRLNIQVQDQAADAGLHTTQFCNRVCYHSNFFARQILL